MKSIKQSNKVTSHNQTKSKLTKQNSGGDSRYQYLMELNNDWIASQNESNNFTRSIN